MGCMLPEVCVEEFNILGIARCVHPSQGPAIITAHLLWEKTSRFGQGHKKNNLDRAPFVDLKKTKKLYDMLLLLAQKRAGVIMALT